MSKLIFPLSDVSVDSFLSQPLSSHGHDDRVYVFTMDSKIFITMTTFLELERA